MVIYFLGGFTMSILDKIIKGSSVVYSGREYKVLGKATYTTRKDPDSTYAKILLEDHHVLVIVPDEMIYFGKNEGQLSEFDSLDKIVQYNGQQFEQVNHDYQLRRDVEFGSPVEVEGDVEFWDYEVGESIISVAKTGDGEERADVVAKYISFDDIEVN